jgi:ATP-dependent RNA/DNA helicase IGHMBP2
VFIDEAAQGLEPATWIPVLSADKVVMAGDHCQLPPTIKSFEAASKGLKETLFEKTISRQPLASKMLLTQYRMPSLIMGFSSQQFYHNQLEAAPSTFAHTLAENQPVLQFIDTAGSGFQEHTDKETLSTMNMDEAKFALARLVDTLKSIGTDMFLRNQWNIGIISPYRAQIELLKELAEEKELSALLKPVKELLTIDTIDGFQGQERDLVIISLVRSNADGVIGFLADTRRMNVALTRAKRQLIVIGDSSTLGTHPFYREYLTYVEENNCYSSIYEWMEY